MTTTALPLSAGLIIISSLSCISLRADLSACVESDIKEVTGIPRFVKKSNWIPKPSKNTRLESVIYLIRSDIKYNVDVYIPKTQTFKPLESNDDSAEFRGLLERLTTKLDFLFSARCIYT
jgi:hypothetical protein